MEVGVEVWLAYFDAVMRLDTVDALICVYEVMREANVDISPRMTMYLLKRYLLSTRKSDRDKLRDVLMKIWSTVARIDDVSPQRAAIRRRSYEKDGGFLTWRKEHPDHSRYYLLAILFHHVGDLRIVADSLEMDLDSQYKELRQLEDEGTSVCDKNRGKSKEKAGSCRRFCSSSSPSTCLLHMTAYRWV